MSGGLPDWLAGTTGAGWGAGAGGEHLVLAFHPLANLFPLIEGEAFDELVADVGGHGGILEAIVIHEGMILDGRNRYRACAAARIPVTADECVAFEAVEPGMDPLDYVLSKNLHRRHLDESQRSMIAAAIATMPRGARTDIAPVGAKSDAEAARLLNVGERSVERAKTVKRDGAPELADAVTRGEVSVSAAAAIVKALPVEAQRALVLEVAKAEDSKRAFAGAVKELRREKQDEKRGRRDERERSLGDKQRALPDRRYGVILADPEWQFEPWSRETGMDRSAENHYATSLTAVIASRPVVQIAADDCVLFLWATAPMLVQALAVMEEWRFAYRSHVVWDKWKVGTGYWVRNQHELLLIGVRGEVPAPAMGTQWNSVQGELGAKHSAKPTWQYDLIEAYFPNVPKIELNARARRPGWDAWGNEAPEEATSPAYDVAELARRLLGVDKLTVNQRLHARRMIAMAEAGETIPLLDLGYLRDVARKHGVAEAGGYLGEAERAALTAAFSDSNERRVGNADALPTLQEVKSCP